MVLGVLAEELFKAAGGQPDSDAEKAESIRLAKCIIPQWIFRFAGGWLPLTLILGMQKNSGQKKMSSGVWRHIISQ